MSGVGEHWPAAGDLASLSEPAARLCVTVDRALRCSGLQLLQL